MSKKVIIIFGAAACVFFLLLVHIGTTFTVQKETKRTEVSYAKVLDWTVESGERDGQETRIYRIVLENEIRGRENLAIYTSHQNLRVWIEDEEVYTLQWIPGENTFGKTPGIHWNFIGITEKDGGKCITVEVTSPYEDVLEIEPEFYLGDKEAISKGIIVADLPFYLVGFALFTVGVILIVFWIYAYSDFKKGSNLLYLGIFSILLAIWLINELKSTVLILYSPILGAYVSFISLMLMPIPFIMYAREMFYNKKSKSWTVFCCISGLQVIASTMLQVLNIREFRETLFLVHGVLAVAFSLIIYHLIKEIVTIGFSRKMKLNLCGIIGCALGGLADITTYYVNHGEVTRMYCAAMFLLYIIVMGMIAMRETYDILQQGKLAKKYEEMAYHDQMTGLYNRAAYAETINDMDIKTSPCTIVMMDLNDLKKCNDIHGHTAGDNYIVQCAKLIENVFENIGTTYRIGGDEFCVIVPEGKAEYCEKALKDLQKKIKEANEKNGKYTVQIAYGYASYDKKQDEELSDTRSRADANMYRMKFAMKEEQKRIEKEQQKQTVCS